MATDPEAKLYRDIDELRESVPKLQKELKTEVKSLKTRLTKLSERIETLELLGFQDQISKLDEKIDLLDEQHTKLKNAVYEFRVLNICGDLHDIIANSDLGNRKSLQTELVRDITKLKYTISQYKDPDAKIKELFDDWLKRLKQLGCKVIEY